MVRQYEDGFVKVTRIHGRGNGYGRHLMQYDRLAVVALQLLRAIRPGIAIRRVAGICCFTMVAAGAIAMAVTVAGTAGTSGLAVLFATILHFGATAAMTRSLEVPEAATSDNRPAVEYGKRYGRPYHGRAEMAADESRKSDTGHGKTSSEAKEMLTA